MFPWQLLLGGTIYVCRDKLFTTWASTQAVNLWQRGALSHLFFMIIEPKLANLSENSIDKNSLLACEQHHTLLAQLQKIFTLLPWLIPSLCISLRAGFIPLELEGWFFTQSFRKWLYLASLNKPDDEQSWSYCTGSSLLRCFLTECDGQSENIFT